MFGTTAVLVVALLTLFGCSEPVPVESPIDPTLSDSQSVEPEQPEFVELSVEEMAATEVDLITGEGTITIRFLPDKAPNHAQNFINLARTGFYDGTRFHRVIPGFMIQGGDPNTINGFPATWGLGGSGTNVKAEFNNVKHTRGIVSAARSGHPDSASSQFFIMVGSYPPIDGQYSVFGEVVSGMDVADRIVAAPRDTNNDRPHLPVAIESAVVRTSAESGEAPTPE